MPREAPKKKGTNKQQRLKSANQIHVPLKIPIGYVENVRERKQTGYENNNACKLPRCVIARTNRKEGNHDACQQTSGSENGNQCAHDALPESVAEAYTPAQTVATSIPLPHPTPPPRRPASGPMFPVEARVAPLDRNDRADQVAANQRSI
jgi:hypothetical protein